MIETKLAFSHNGGRHFLLALKFVHSQALTSEEIGSVIRQRRKDMDVTLDNLSLVSGISRKTLIKLEKGGDVNFSTLTTVLGLLGLHLTFKPIVPPQKDGDDESEWI